MKQTLPCRLELLNGTFSSLKTASAKVLSKSQTSPWTCNGIGTDSNSEDNVWLWWSVVILSLFQNTCLLWHNFKTVSKSSYITGESKLEQVSEFCQKIRQIEGGSALLSFNVNTLSRVFPSFVKLSKIEDFWMSWRNNRQS